LNDRCWADLDFERLVYDHPKLGPGARGAPILTSLDLLERLAILLPPPRHPSLLRRAGADGRSRENWLARPKVCTWPTPGRSGNGSVTRGPRANDSACGGHGTSATRDSRLVDR
jgi:hypothetical protein